MSWLTKEYIIIALRNDRLTTYGVIANLIEMGEGESHGTVSRHLRKMHERGMLERERGMDRSFVYWNPVRGDWPDDLKEAKRQYIEWRFSQTRRQRREPRPVREPQEVLPLFDS